MAVRRDPRTRRWYFVIDVPTGPDGRRRQMHRRGYTTQKAAQAAETAIRQQFGQAALAVDGTVAAELDRWLEERELDLSITGLSSYRDHLRAYVLPHIGARQIATLDKNAIHDLYRTLLRRGTQHGTPLAHSTVRTVHRILSKALRDLGVEIAGVRQPRREPKPETGRRGVWSAEQTLAFLKAARDDRLYAAWVLATVCGMRRGELAGLRWSKIDFERGIIRTDWQRTIATGQGDHGVVEKETKGTSARNIAIGAAVIAVLREHKQRQEREKAVCGVLYRNEDRVFCHQDGTGYRPGYLSTRFGALCVAAGVPQITLHDARHTSATVGADAGVPQHAMQNRLGHAEARMTAYYTHVLPPAQRKAADIMEQTLLPDLRTP